MPAAISHRASLLLASAAAFAAVTAVFVLVETPGLGTGHFFYLGIALAALATNGRLGAVAGLVATALYCIGTVFNPLLPSHDVVTLSTLIRAITYVSSGALIGSFADSHRRLADRLRGLAERDYLTGLLNVRAFEEELQRRCLVERGFTLLVGDVDGLKAVNDRDGHAEGNLFLRRIAAALVEVAGDGDHVARIGGDEFALLTRGANQEDAIALCRQLELELERRRVKISFGWALNPSDGVTSTELFRRADERLYSSKVTRKSRDSVVALLAGARPA